MNELQMSSYARQYDVLGVETRDHVTAIIIRHTMVINVVNCHCIWSMAYTFVTFVFSLGH